MNFVFNKNCAVWPNDYYYVCIVVLRETDRPQTFIHEFYFLLSDDIHTVARVIQFYKVTIAPRHHNHAKQMYVVIFLVCSVYLLFAHINLKTYA